MTTSDHFTIDGHKLVYAQHGDPNNPPLVLIHGWLSSHRTWKPSIPFLEPHFHVIAVDLLGFGESDKPTDGDYAIPAQAKRVLALLDSLGIDRFALMGHSMGGLTALYIAAQLAPERVERLVSVAGVVSGRLVPDTKRTADIADLPAPLPTIIITLSRMLRNQKWWVVLQYEAGFYDLKRNWLPRIDEWAHIRTDATLPGIAVPMREAAHAMYALDLTTRLKQIQCPVVAIFGNQDRVVFPSDGQLVADYVPQGSVITYDECGHHPHYEQPAAFERDVLAFLQNP